MRTGLKAAAVLLVTLPMLAYVAGRLAAAPPDPGPRDPVILRSPIAPAESSPTAPREPGGEDDGGVRVVNPHPTRVVGEDDGTASEADDDRTDDDTSGGDD